MKKFLLKYSSYLFLVVWFLFLTVSLFAITQNVGRGLVVLLLLTVWLVVALKWNFSVELFAYTLLASSFNVTITFNNITECFVKGVYINYLCPTVSILDIIIILNIVLFLSEKLKGKENLKWKNIFNIFKPFTILVPFYIYSLIHIIIHSDVITIITMLRLNLYLSLIPIFGMVIKDFLKSLLDKKKSNEKTNNQRSLILFLFFFVSLAIQLFIGIFQFIRGRDLGLQILGESNLLSGTISTSFMSTSFGLFLRSYGTFPHPNVLGGYALVIAILGYLFFFSKKKSYYFILLLTSGLLVLLSFSRTAILLYVILFVFSIYESLKGKMFSVLPLFLNRFININLGETSIVDRVNLLKASWEIFKNNWFIGVGNSNFIASLGGFNLTTNGGLSLLQPVHNIFALIFVEHGLIGGLYTLIFLGYLKVKESVSYLMNKGLFIYSIFVIVLIGMLDHYLLTLPQGIFIFSLLLMI